MINDRIIRRYIEQQGEQPDGRYLLKDSGEGEFIAKWEYLFPKPTDAHVTSIVEELNREKIMREWQRQMNATDDAMPRHMEDLIDTLAGLLPLLDNMPVELLEAYNKKKSIRAEKPPGG